VTLACLYFEDESPRPAPAQARTGRLSLTRSGAAQKTGDSATKATQSVRDSRGNNKSAPRPVCVPGNPRGRDSGADRRREQHRHSLGLAFVPHGNQLPGVLEDLAIGRAASSRFLLGLLPARRSSILRLLKPIRIIFSSHFGLAIAMFRQQALGCRGIRGNF
jgi:hypothetical protein